MTYYKELGKKLREHHEAIDDKVERIDKYQKYTNTELDYCYCQITESKTAVTNDVPPQLQIVESKNIELNATNDGVILKKGKTYHISTFILVMNKAAYFQLYDVTNSKILAYACSNIDSINGPTECIYTPEIDCEIQLIPYSVVNGSIYITTIGYSFITVQEINRQIVIDPVEHVNESQGIEDTPVGHIIAHMGTVAPKHYLICDGTEYNITDYPYLAQHIEDNFGSINFFGGDGETTFAVPDLRGEFLRGTGAATRDTGTGASVGVHQNGTIMPNIWLYHNTNQKWQLQAEVDPNVPSGLRIANGDKYYAPSGSTRFNLAYGELTLNKYTGQPDSSQITIRPTNTSVLYCIKYEPTYFMNTYNTNYMQPNMYSEEERIVGCWIDGRPLYQKTIKITTSSDSNGTSYPTGLTNVNNAHVTGGFTLGTNGYTHPVNMSTPVSTGAPQMSFCDIKTDGTSIYFRTNISILYNTESFVIIQYTKTTDEENSFTNDMLKDSYVELTYSNEEISTMVSDILGGEE